MIGKDVQEVEALERSGRAPRRFALISRSWKRKALAGKGLSIRWIWRSGQAKCSGWPASSVPEGPKRRASFSGWIGRIEGTVLVNGRTVKFNSPRAAIRYRIALTPEDRKVAGIIPNPYGAREYRLSAAGQPGNLAPFIRPEQEKLADRFIQSLGIKTPNREQLLRNLSGGNQQKGFTGPLAGD